MAEEYDMPFLGEIPLVQSIQEGGDMGIPAVLDNNAVAKDAFMAVTKNVARNIAMRNANLEPTKIVEMEN